MRKHKIFAAALVVCLLASLATPVLASPPYPEGPAQPLPIQPPEVIPPLRAERAKAIDQPNVKEYQKLEERQRLLEAGMTAEANALAQTGTDRVLVILVEFAGTDVFTWQQGVSVWDPLGIADPNEYTGTVGDCSNIITQTTVFTYSGPMHNELPRPVSPEDRSGDSIWTEDFNSDWYDDFMFGQGVVFNYTMQDGTPVFEDFSGESVTNYYKDMSSGVYTITGDIIGWVPVDHSTWYYDTDACPGARSGTSVPRGGLTPGGGTSRTLVKDALDAVNAISDTIPGFDWANYDLDHNGIIDRLWIVHAGYGEEDSTTLLNRTGYGEAAVWSHSSSVSPPYQVAPGIAAGPYIIMPENGGIGVFAHEYGHNLGADDLYAYDQGETSAGFWTLMADDWTGYPIGFEPPSVDPWHLDRWGWLDPMVVNDTTQVYTVTLGQASEFPGGDMSRGAKIELDDGLIPLSVPVWQGDYYWWGGKQDLANAMMTTASAIDLTGATAATLSFDLVYDIEDEWDFLWVQVSTNGTTWDYADTLTNTNTQCVHDPSWIGGLNGFPEDLCAENIGGFYGYNDNWPDPQPQQFDLTPYVGQQIYLRFWFMTDWGTTYTGAFIDNVEVEADGSVVFSDNAESGDANWVYTAPWIRTNGVMPYTHNFYLQWRNVSDNGGYDSALGEARWRYGPANSGLLVWYNNNFYTDNEIWTYLFDDPSVGPKGRMLVVDAHPTPYRDPDMVDMGFNNEGGNLASRGQMRDAPFTLTDTVPFVYTEAGRAGATEHSYSGRPATTSFHDSFGYYPGAEYVRRGPVYPLTQFKWVTAQWDASATVPAKVFYPLNAMGYPGGTGTSDDEFRFNCAPYVEGPLAGYLSCYWFGTGIGLGYPGGTGNPGDYLAQYGWHVELLDEAADHTSATVRIWNSLYELDDDFSASPTEAGFGRTVDYAYHLNQNIGSPVDLLTLVPMADTVQYVPGSATGGAFPLPVGIPAQQLAAIYAEGGREALEDLAAGQDVEVGAVAWMPGDLGTAVGDMGFGFSVQVMVNSPTSIDLAALHYKGGVFFQKTAAPTLETLRSVYLPVVFK